MADWDVVGQSPAQAPAPSKDDPWAVQGEAKVNSETAGTFDSVVNRMKGVAGEAASVLDLGLGMPGFLVGTGAAATGALAARMRGVPWGPNGRPDPVTAWTVGREAAKTFGEPLSEVGQRINPLRILLNTFRSGDAIEHSKTNEGMAKLTSKIEQAGKWVEDQTGGQIGRDAVPMLVDTLMAAAPGLFGGKKPGAVPEHVQTALRQHAEKMRADAEAEIAQKRAEALTPAEAGARVPVQQQINDMLGIRSPVEQARITRERKSAVQQTFGPKGPTEEPLPPEIEGQRGREYQDAGESAHYADERMQREGAYTGETEAADIAGEAARRDRPVGQAEILEVMRKAPEERTADDIATLRKAHQEGKASPEALMLVTAAGLGALAGEALDDEKLRGATLGGLTGLAAVLPFLGRGPSVPSSFKQSGAVKGPGGIWHPEAVERLAAPLSDTLVRNLGAQLEAAERAGDSGAGSKSRIETGVDWSKKAVKNYLNRYAGTERDPLKDVEIPFGAGVKRWEEVMDASVSREAGENIPGGRRGEIGYNFGYKGAEAREAPLGARDISAYGPKAISSYLSHVGDYLRQNVDPAKLQQYDLVRAVKETAENDKRVAKEMEKAAAESSKDLPVYKEYSDGMKWVELKEPKELTPEQAKSVRRLTKEEVRDEFNAAGDELNEAAYVALDSKGKPVRNAYTDELASGETPEKAYLAGRLAEEGNQMGHCVGGYCEGVASGESKIYSLRDKKGLSHVTVEVTGPESPIHFGEKVPASESPTLDISQIKGKQNRAPNKEYLPYVQDFVKSGKWGEVGDLEHTGLVDTVDFMERQKLPFKAPERYMSGAALGEWLATPERNIKAPWLKEGGPRVTEVPENYQELRDRFNRGERGSIDQQLLMGLGAVGLGGLIGSQLSDEPGSGALLGALAAGALRMPGVQKRFTQAVNAADYGLGALSTRIGNISPAVLHRARTFEMRNLSEAYERLHKVAPFMQELDKVKGQLRSALDRAILTNDREGIAALMKGNPALVKAWRETRGVLQEVGTKLQGYGRFKSMREDYFPRLVKDVEGLKQALDIPVRTRLEQKLAEANEKAMKNRGTPLTNIEESAIVNQELMGSNRQPRGYQPGYTKARGVEEITKELQKFYYTPSESLYAYIRGATTDLEMAKFFGKDLAQKSAGGAQYIDLDTSIGNVVGSELRSGKITHPQAQELISMLQSRFRGGERSSNGLVQDIRNLANMGLLGNIVSAGTQMADAMMAVYAQDLRSTLSALAKSKVSVRDFGLADHVAEEFTSTSKTADWLNKSLKYSSFAGIDRFGKGTNLNAPIYKYERLASTPEGIRRIKEKYGEAYGKELPALIRDLQAGNITERVRALAFSELSDLQPVSKLELPQAYLDNPNGRLIYMLKSYMLKQVDIARRDVYNEYKKGNLGKALKNGTEYALVLGLAGAATDVVKNWLMGRKISFDHTDVAENILKTFGFGEYVRDKIKQGKPVEALLGTIVPPYKMMDEIIRRDPKAVQYIPIIGKLYYNWELGGREEAEMRDARKAKKAGREVELSERTQSYRDAKRERAREKKERE